ncbi:hypothetical protein [Halorarum salinum]|uniref:Uncharacterized protein n=1 Tax=Halorarum salinum TaxID=2743089 RepID=A0A7D5QLK1_9EURY|nr:hypothetical protein [Halobaculum salinum]QLG62845.1 hypothetical protein HUG12_14350 [Halobaculum salinum]
MSATTHSARSKQFVGSSLSLESGDKIVTNYGGEFDSWAKQAEEMPEMGPDYEDWYKVKGGWDGAACFDLWYSWRTSKWHMSPNGDTQKVYVCKV